MRVESKALTDSAFTASDVPAAECGVSGISATELSTVHANTQISAGQTFSLAHPQQQKHNFQMDNYTSAQAYWRRLTNSRSNFSLSTITSNRCGPRIDAMAIHSQLLGQRNEGSGCLFNRRYPRAPANLQIYYYNFYFANFNHVTLIMT